MSKQNRPQYLVSTDSIGFLGKSEQFIELWQEYFDNKTLDGVEVIAFKPLSRLSRLISILAKNKIPVLSFHGKTGGEDQLHFGSRIVMTLVNFFIIDVKTLLINFPKIEFLSHVPYFKNNSIKQIVLNDKPKKIWIENQLSGKKGIDESIKQIIAYRKNGINAYGMLDIFHYVVHSLKFLNTNWPTTVEEIRSYLFLKDEHEKRLFTGIHFPIGTRLGDSLPIDRMTDEMLILFAKKVIPQVERVVFENQQENLGLFFSNIEMLEEQKSRNTRIIDRLKKTGIILGK